MRVPSCLLCAVPFYPGFSGLWLWLILFVAGNATRFCRSPQVLIRPFPFLSDRKKSGVVGRWKGAVCTWGCLRLLGCGSDSNSSSSIVGRGSLLSFGFGDVTDELFFDCAIVVSFCEMA